VPSEQANSVMRSRDQPRGWRTPAGNSQLPVTLSGLCLSVHSSLAPKLHCNQPVTINGVKNGDHNIRIYSPNRLSSRAHNRRTTLRRTTEYTSYTSVKYKVKLPFKRHKPQVEYSRPTYPTRPPSQAARAPSRSSPTYSQMYPYLPTAQYLPLRVGRHHSAQRGAGG
jgi:hypothetical protein